MNELTENNISIVDTADEYVKPGKSEPEIVNPFSKDQRRLLGRWSRYSKEQNLLEPHQRRYLYFGSKYDRWYDNLPNKLAKALEDLESELPNEEDSEAAVDLKIILHFEDAKSSAEKGISHAQETVGDYWRWGLHAEVDIEEAIKWYEMAAEQGNTDAMVSLANTYFWSDDYNIEIARPWYEKAAAEEDAEAECMMGILEDDPEVKADWFEKAALQKYAEAQYSLAQIYQKGNGRPKDYQKAMQLYEKAAGQGDAMALRALGNCYFFGELAEEDDQRALEYFRKGADKDDTISKIMVGKCYYLGLGVGEDDSEAVKWFEQAISDDERSLAEDEMHSIGGECYGLLGECYLKGFGVEKDLDKAVELLETGSHLDDDHAQYLLGVCYAEGLSVSQDPEEAFELFLASAQKENQDAIEEVIRCYRDGVGIAQDLVEAEDWHSKLEKPHGDEEKYERAVERQALQREVKTNNMPRTEKVLGSENVISFPNQANREEVLDRIQERIQQHIPELIGVGELIATDENARRELKSSARFDTQLNQRNDDLELVIVKTVAAFLNTHGGTLIIGVTEDKKIIGLAGDFNTFDEEKDRNVDAYGRYIRQLLQNTLPVIPSLRSIETEFEKADGLDVCIIKVEPSDEPALIHLEKNRKIYNEKPEKIKALHNEGFFVRRGNSTVSLSKQDMANYMLAHFQPPKRK